MILPLNYRFFSPGILKVLRERNAEYLFSRQEPKFVIDIFQTVDGFIEVYVHKRGYNHSHFHQGNCKAI